MPVPTLDQLRQPLFLPALPAQRTEADRLASSGGDQYVEDAVEHRPALHRPSLLTSKPDEPDAIAARREDRLPTAATDVAADGGPLFKWCSCRDDAGRRFGTRCPRLRRVDGSWDGAWHVGIPVGVAQDR
jgi:hypothetical protein